MAEKVLFDRISIIGVGLIGASLSLAIKENGACPNIIGYGRNEKRLRDAKSFGIIDHYTLSLEEASDADLIVLATPVGTFEKIAREISKFIKHDTIVIDVGSVKAEVVNTLEEIFGDRAYFIGTHPIAGSDKTGFEHARANLYKGARVIITPTEKTHKPSLNKIKKLWERIGAFVEIMPADEHDKIYALVSHLPHLVAFSLVNTVAEVDSNLLKYAGSGFMDTTRIAMSSPEIWKDILCMNKNNIIKMLNAYVENLLIAKQMLEENCEEKITDFIKKAKTFRESL